MSNIEILSLPLGEEDIPKLALDREKTVDTIDKCLKFENLKQIRREVRGMMDRILENPDDNPWSATEVSPNGKTYYVDREIFIGNLEQIEKTRSLRRTRYYLQRLKKSITRVRTGKINDINLNRWKEYREIRTDSLWIDKKRSRQGKHISSYWGNFIPQIPRQMMLRYTKGGEYVLDTFAGSGTTLIECRRLGRNGIGFELNPAVARKAQFLVDSEDNPFDVTTRIINANSARADYSELLGEIGIKKVQLVIMHPPYHDIIRFSDFEDDLSNAADVEDFLDKLEEIGRLSYEVLDRGRFACLVIGDKYNQGEWIPLGFYSMQRMMNIGYRLKSVIVKNFDQTRGKRRQKELWRYRALAGGYYIFKHEYIFVLQRD